MPRKVLDIRRPRRENGADPITPPKAHAPLRRPLWVRAAYFVTVVALFLALGFSFIRILDFKTLISLASSRLTNEFRATTASLQEFDLPGAGAALTSVGETLGIVHDAAKATPLASLSLLTDLFSSLKTLGGTTYSLGGYLQYLSGDGVSDFLTRNGERLLHSLGGLLQEITSLRGSSSTFAAQALRIGLPFPDATAHYEPLFAAESFLSALHSLLSSTTEVHIALLFLNHSELRPGGGFLGSFADISILRGALQGITVNDVYDYDGQLDIKVIPPRELQGITARWGARDANWFFDFPTSAAKTLWFLEQSKIYQEQSRTFQGVIAINMNVLSDLLRITGPIELPEFNRRVTAETVFEEVQSEVRSGADREVGDAKRILKLLAPRLLEKLGALSGEEQRALLAALTARVHAKDIMMYMKDLALQDYLTASGLAGEIKKRSSDSFSDYVGVALANVGGGKTDVVHDQSIALVSRIDSDGGVSNTLSISREHRGNRREEPWYATQSNSLIHAYVPWRSELLSIHGGSSENPRVPTRYDSSFVIDPDLRGLEVAKAFESTSFFSRWLSLSPGERGGVAFSYQLPNRLSLASSTPYALYFDKQSGALTTFEATIYAPSGYVWQSTGSETLTYVSDAPPGRVTLTDTLIPAPL